MLALLIISGNVLAKQDYTAAYQKCIDVAQTTASISSCNNDEIARQDKRLNQAYKKAIAGLQAPNQARLRDAQRLWVKYRDSNCGMYFKLTGGTIDVINGGSCRLSMTKDRADELDELLGP
jgi:uncharacterized protein YecT (DUF1311 family)